MKQVNEIKVTISKTSKMKNDNNKTDSIILMIMLIKNQNYNNMKL